MTRLCIIYLPWLMATLSRRPVGTSTALFKISWLINMQYCVTANKLKYHFLTNLLQALKQQNFIMKKYILMLTRQQNFMNSNKSIVTEICNFFFLFERQLINFIKERNQQQKRPKIRCAGIRELYTTLVTLKSTSTEIKEKATPRFAGASTKIP